MNGIFLGWDDRNAWKLVSRAEGVSVEGRVEKGSIKFSIQSWLLSLNSEPQKSRSASISDSTPPCMQICRWGAKVIAATRLWVDRFANRGSRKGRQEQGTFLRRVKRLSQGWRTFLRAQTSSLAAPCRTPVGVAAPAELGCPGQ